MSAKTTKRFRTTANPEWNKAMAEKGRSSCTGSHDTRPNRQRTRKDATRAAIRNGW